MHLSPQWLWLLTVLRQWFCCCWFVVDCYSHCGIMQLFHVLLCVILCSLYFCNHLDGEERSGCFGLFVFLVSRDCCVALSHDATALSAVCDCGISWSYSLFFVTMEGGFMINPVLKKTKLIDLSIRFKILNMNIILKSGARFKFCF